MLKKSQAKFIFYFLITFVSLFALLYSVGLVPEVIKPNEGDTIRTLWDQAREKTINTTEVMGENPLRIVIEKIGVDASIFNPQTTNVTTLDEYLKQGAVHYPGSGLIGQGNMFIFGHSTGLTVVRNQAYKTFNNLKNLQAGDKIKIYGASKVYTYQVSSVVLVDANQALVEFDNRQNILTLSTCNTFGGKEERYVVTADYLP